MPMVTNLIDIIIGYYGVAAGVPIVKHLHHLKGSAGGAEFGESHYITEQYSNTVEALSLDRISSLQKFSYRSEGDRIISNIFYRATESITLVASDKGAYLFSSSLRTTNWFAPEPNPRDCKHISPLSIAYCRICWVSWNVGIRYYKVR